MTSNGRVRQGGGEVGYYPIFATGNAIPSAQRMKSIVHWLCRYHDIYWTVTQSSAAVAVLGQQVC
jgi:hypothetical protein